MNLYSDTRLETYYVAICEECGEPANEDFYTPYGAGLYAVEEGWQEVIVDGQKLTVCKECYNDLLGAGQIEQTLVPTLG